MKMEEITKIKMGGENGKKVEIWLTFELFLGWAFLLRGK